MVKRKIFVMCLCMVLVSVFAGAAWAAESAKININTASAEELTKLKRVGQKYAEKIIEYREMNGLFEKPEDILNVSGIGPKTWEANKEVIIVGPPEKE